MPNLSEAILVATGLTTIDPQFFICFLRKFYYGLHPQEPP